MAFAMTPSPTRMRQATTPSTSITPMRASFVAEDDDARQQRQRDDTMAMRLQLEQVWRGQRSIDMACIPVYL